MQNHSARLFIWEHSGKREKPQRLRGIKNCLVLDFRRHWSIHATVTGMDEYVRYDKRKRDIKSDADRVRVSIVSSSLARNRIRLSINTRTKSSTRRRRRNGKNETEGTERQVETVGTLPAHQPSSRPNLFKRPAHSSWPDSLTIIKRKSFYFTVTSRLRSYFLPPVSIYFLFFFLSFPLSFFPCAFALPHMSSHFFPLLHCPSISHHALILFPVILLSNYSHLLCKRHHLPMNNSGRKNGIIT